jgi:hypothetical protein
LETKPSSFPDETIGESRHKERPTPIRLLAGMWRIGVRHVLDAYHAIAPLL